MAGDPIRVDRRRQRRVPRGAARLLEAQPDLAVVGEAATGAAALALAARTLPDVVLMDLQMPDLDGIAATRRLAAANPHVGVLVVTMFEDDESVFAAMRAGARGYPAEGRARPRRCARSTRWSTGRRSSARRSPAA